jgi:hypothetical protein
VVKRKPLAWVKWRRPVPLTDRVFVDLSSKNFLWVLIHSQPRKRINLDVWTKLQSVATFVTLKLNVSKSSSLSNHDLNPVTVVEITLFQQILFVGTDKGSVFAYRLSPKQGKHQGTQHEDSWLPEALVNLNLGQWDWQAQVAVCAPILSIDVAFCSHRIIVTYCTRYRLFLTTYVAYHSHLWGQQLTSSVF